MRDFSDLPVVQCKAGPTDEEIAFWGDLAYMRALLDDISRAAAELRGVTW